MPTLIEPELAIFVCRRGFGPQHQSNTAIETLVAVTDETLVAVADGMLGAVADEIGP